MHGSDAVYARQHDILRDDRRNTLNVVRTQLSLQTCNRQNLSIAMKPSVPAIPSVPDSAPSLQALQQAAHVVYQADDLFREVPGGAASLLPFGLTRDRLTEADRRRLLIRVLDAALEVTKDIDDIRSEMALEQVDETEGDGGQPSTCVTESQTANSNDAQESDEGHFRR